MIDEKEVVKAYTEDLVPMIELAKRYNVTRQGIWKALKRCGVDTSKGKVKVKCYACGAELWRGRARIRKTKHHFCNNDCYFAFLDAGNCGGEYKVSRNGQRIARRLVSEHFELGELNVVHHKNRDCFNNNLWNLMVFATQGDHVRHHRGIDVVPLWDGERG